MGNLIQYIIQEDPEKEDLEFRRKTFSEQPLLIPKIF